MQEYFTQEYYETMMSDAVSGWWRRRFIRAPLQRRLDKLVAQAMRRSLTASVERAFERTDAYVWLLRADPDKSVRQELLRIEAAVRDGIRRQNHEHDVLVSDDPLRVEILKQRIDLVPLLGYAKALRKLPRDKYLFVPGVRQRVSDHVLHEMSLSSPDVAQLLISGSTGSGKTLLAVSILMTMAMLNRPSKLAMLVIDPKHVDIGNTDIQRLPHLAHPVITDTKLAVAAIYRLATEMERRQADIDACTARRQRWVMPGRIFCYVDELGDVVEADEKVADVLAWIARQGRGLGIHLCLATQRPTVDVVTGHLRANLPARFGGWVRSADEARIATGVPESGLEKLSGSGMFKLFTRSQGINLQGFYVDLDDDLPKLVDDLRYNDLPCWTIGSLRPEERAPESVLDAVEEHVEESGADLFNTVLQHWKEIGKEPSLNKISDLRVMVEGKSLDRDKARELREQVREVLKQEVVNAG